MPVFVSAHAFERYEERFPAARLPLEKTIEAAIEHGLRLHQLPAFVRRELDRQSASHGGSDAIVHGNVCLIFTPDRSALRTVIKVPRRWRRAIVLHRLARHFAPRSHDRTVTGM